MFFTNWRQDSPPTKRLWLALLWYFIAVVWNWPHAGTGMPAASPYMLVIFVTMKSIIELLHHSAEGVNSSTQLDEWKCWLLGKCVNVCVWIFMHSEDISHTHTQSCENPEGSSYISIPCFSNRLESGRESERPSIYIYKNLQVQTLVMVVWLSCRKLIALEWNSNLILLKMT